MFRCGNIVVERLKIAQNRHEMCRRFVSNAYFATPTLKHVLSVLEFGSSVVEFCRLDL